MPPLAGHNRLRRQLGAAVKAVDPIAVMVGRLNLERYKATVKGLTQFGDRRQGTDRNRAAIDWIEAQLKSYGCTNTERIHYDYSLWLALVRAALAVVLEEGIHQWGRVARGSAATSFPTR